MQSNAHVAAAPGGTAPQPELQAALQRLKIWEKLKRGELHTITKENVQELFRVLDSEDRGEIPKEALQQLRTIPNLNLSEADIQALANDCDKDNSGRLSVDELYKALTQGELAFSMIKDSLGKKAAMIDDQNIALPKVIEWVQNEYETQSALWSLPMTMILFATFMALQTIHMQISRSWEQQYAIQNEVVGEGPPYLTNHEWAIVHDVPTLWEWLNTSWASAHFKQPISEVFPYPGRLASFNQIVGGVQFKKTEVVDNGPCMQGDILRSVYDSQEPIMGGCHRELGEQTVSEYFLYHERIETIHAHLTNLSDSNWINQNTTMLDMQMLLYNAHMQVFTDTHLKFSFLSSGRVWIYFNMETFRSEPYQNMLFLGPDLIFCLIIFRMLYQELKELVPAAMGGLDALSGYMEFWNVIDWVSIILGIVVMVMWGQVVTWVGGSLQENIMQFPIYDLDSMVLTNGTFLTVDHVEQVMPHEELYAVITNVHDWSEKIAQMHIDLRLTIFFYSFVLMMKFFKAFQANPRLEIVTETLRLATVDITHFMIIFCVIFFCFSCAGFVLFGRAIRGFSTQMKSMVQCWKILMGEFDVDEMAVYAPLLGPIWLFSFQFLVFLILLNMLLAIIMDRYMQAKSAVGATGLTIWAQMRDAARTVRETRGHINLYKLMVDLTDEDFPAHPQPVVTSKTLRRAFPKMTKHNAEYIMRKTTEWLKNESEECELTMVDAIRLIGLIKTTTLRAANDTEAILDMMKVEKRKPQEARFDAIWNDPDSKLPPGQMMLGQSATSYNASGMMGSHQANGYNGYNANDMMLMNSMRQGTPNMMQSQMGTTGSSWHSGGFGAGDIGAGTNSMGLGPGGQFRPGTGISSAPSGNLALTMGNNAATTTTGGGGGGEMNSALLSQVVSTVEAMRKDQVRFNDSAEGQLNEVRRLQEEQHTWFEQRLNQLERRMEKVERGNERVVSGLQGIDFAGLTSLPQKLDAWAPRMRQIRDSSQPLMLPSSEAESYAGLKDEDEEDEDELYAQGGSKGSSEHPNAVSPAQGARPSNDGKLARVGTVQKVTASLEHIQQQLEQLIAQGDDAVESRRLLWKLDLGVRQLKEKAGIGAQGANNAQPSSLTSKRVSSGSLFDSEAGSPRSLRGAAQAASPSRTPSGILRNQSNRGAGSSAFHQVPEDHPVVDAPPPNSVARN